MRFEFTVLAFAALVGPLSGIAGAQRSALGPWVVVLPPWRTASSLVEAAGGRLIGPVEAPMSVFVSATEPGVAERLEAAGAWAVLDPSSLELICGPGA